MSPSELAAYVYAGDDNAFWIFLLLTVVIPFCLFKALGWGFARRPFVTFLAALLTLILLIGSFQLFFPACAITGWGRSAVRCAR